MEAPIPVWSDISGHSILFKIPLKPAVLFPPLKPFPDTSGLARADPIRRVKDLRKTEEEVDCPKCVFPFSQGARISVNFCKFLRILAKKCKKACIFEAALECT